MIECLLNFHAPWMVAAVHRQKLKADVIEQIVTVPNCPPRGAYLALLKASNIVLAEKRALLLKLPNSPKQVPVWKRQFDRDYAAVAVCPARATDYKLRHFTPP